MADDDEELAVPKEEEEEKLRGGEAAPPSAESERPTRADVENDAAAPAKKGSSGAVSAAKPDGGSFSQLPARTMTSPAGSPRPSPVLTVPVLAVPCLLAPAALIESSGFTGQFAMTHQAVLAAVTAQAQLQIQAACSPTSETKTNSFPHSMLPTVTPVPLQQTSPDHESYSDDSYHWRKYGQKQVKNTENSRSYYKCAVSNCSSKKKVERSPDGKIREVIYRGKHNHDPPLKYRYTRYKGSQSGGPSGENESIEHLSNEPKELDPSALKTENHSGIDPPEQQFCSSDGEDGAAIAKRKDFAEEPDPKRRLSESSKSPPTPAPKAAREYVVQTEIDARHFSDGYRWRKYGQKMVKGNPNPRSYYRCTHDGCPVRKHVEKASHDAKSLLITYEGKHNHDQPMPKHASDQPASDGPASSTDKELNTYLSLSDKESLKELNPTDVVKEIPSDKAPELGGDMAKKSALSSACNEGNERTSTEGVITPLLDKNPAAVSVKNS